MSGAAIAISVILCLSLFVWMQSRNTSGGAQNRRDNRQLRPQHPQLERKLVKLLGGNHQAANRLIQQSQLRHPDRSADWHWEKAIYDLERDRWR
ncbi:hypothetical protein [Chamaesiphon sp. VAR_48_metabat_403]|uniref:hypothetical protein n=1 Tax=Chamaesiphon sp. VAR_48_metabat_403 TaxID=2964700 RepID=UPI00286E1311|nr:hypothetical protein [Chamaesiphon sp. VAR_48_metabat_403]